MNIDNVIETLKSRSIERAPSSLNSSFITLNTSAIEKKIVLDPSKIRFKKDPQPNKIIIQNNAGPKLTINRSEMVGQDLSKSNVTDEILQKTRDLIRRQREKANETES